MELQHFDPALLEGTDTPGLVFGQNLICGRRAVHTTHTLGRDLGTRSRYALASGLAQTGA
jgi:hypothetical protein